MAGLRLALPSSGLLPRPPRRRLGRSGLIGLLLAWLPLYTAALQDPGIMYLDDLTFSKVVNGRDDVLVRFDKEYPWGPDHDSFKELARILGEGGVPLIVAGVPISNRDEYLLNPRLARRYGLHTLKDDELPQFRLFVSGFDPRVPLNYSGKPTAEEMSGWLVAEANIFLGKKGQIEQMDATAKQFYIAKPEHRQALYEAAKKEAAELPLSRVHREYADYYLKLMQRVIKKGTEDYLAQEFTRIARLLAKAGSLSSSAIETFEWRLNVIQSFVPSVKPAEKRKKKKRAAATGKGAKAAAAKQAAAAKKAAAAKAGAAAKKGPAPKGGKQQAGARPGVAVGGSSKAAAAAAAAVKLN